jgi:hypothetical protein
MDIYENAYRLNCNIKRSIHDPYQNPHFGRYVARHLLKDQVLLHSAQQSDGAIGAYKSHGDNSGKVLPQLLISHVR